MDISTGYQSPIVALARSTNYERIEGRLTIYDLESGGLTRDFTVQYDPGGERLALSRNSLFCFVGCYKVHGLAAYSAQSGEELWRRRDLKAVQSVVAFPFDDVVFCGRQDLSGHLLCARTGKTIEKPRSVKEVYPSPFTTHVLVSAGTLDLHSPFGKRIGKIERTTFAVLDCCFSDSEILITESGGSVRCIDLDSLELLWTHKPKPSSHFVRLCFSQALRCFVGIWFSNDSRDPVRIVHFERGTGTVLREIPLSGPANQKFCLAGSMVFTQDCRLISIETGEVMREFGHPEDVGHST